MSTGTVEVYQNLKLEEYLPDHLTMEIAQPCKRRSVMS